MQSLKTYPTPLTVCFRGTMLIGAACQLFSVIYYTAVSDNILLLLGSVLFLFCIGRSISLFQLMRRADYETVEGICISIFTNPLKKHRKIRLLDKNGVEHTLLLAKNSKFQIGYSYRFYFRTQAALSLGSGYLSTLLSSNQFLGFECFGEYNGGD